MAVTITFVETSGAEHAVSAEPGLSAMEVAIWNGVPGIEATCGGSMACGTCLVHLDDPAAAGISPVSVSEAELLTDHEGAGAHARLSCQLSISPASDGLRLHVPERQRDF